MVVSEDPLGEDRTEAWSRMAMELARSSHDWWWKWEYSEVERPGLATFVGA